MANDLLRGRQTVEKLTNKSGAEVVEGDTVIIYESSPNAFTTVAELGQADYFTGVVLETIAVDADGRVVFFGHAPKVYLDNYAGIGDWLITSATGTLATAIEGLRAGVFGQAITSGTFPEALIFGAAPFTANITGSSAGHTIQEDGIDKTTRSNLNFVGNFVDVTDDAGNDATIVSITGSGGHTIKTSAGVSLTQRTNLSVTGATAEFYDDAGLDTTFLFVSGSGGAGGGDSTYTDAYASRPAASNDGDLFLPSDGFTLQRDTGSAWVSWGPLFPLTAPVSGDFAWINQGAATISITNGGIYLYMGAGAGDNIRIRKKAAPSTPYTITAAMILHLTTANYGTAGLCWRQSSDGKIVTLAPDPSTSFSITSNKYTDETTYSAAYLSAYPPKFAMSPIVFFRLADDGTDRAISLSWDGINFLTLHTVGRTDYITADEVGFFVNPSNATYPAALTLLSWKEA